MEKALNLLATIGVGVVSSLIRIQTTPYTEETAKKVVAYVDSALRRGDVGG